MHTTGAERWRTGARQCAPVLFGLAAALALVSRSAGDAPTTQPQLTSLGTVLGTPYYMAPEQAVGQSVDGRADQYALAVVGFEMLVGRVPFDDETPHGIIHQHINEPPPDVTALRPDVPRRVAATIARGMRKAPASRFATMEEFATALSDPTPMEGSATTGGRAAVRTRRLEAADADAPTRVLGAEDQELDSALERVFDGGAGRRRRRSVALRLMIALLLLCALAAGTVWAGTKWKPVRRILERAALMPRTAPAKMSAKTTATTAAPRVPHTTNAATSTPGKASAAKSLRRTAPLSITSSPRATVLIDGVKIGETPISGRTLTVGRTYRIQVERKGYRTRRETITVTGTRPVRRSYTLVREGRR
jgi:hypothetical protein